MISGEGGAIPPPKSRTQMLRDLLARDCCHVMPCCGDPLSAKMIEQAGFELSFMSGFSASALRIGAPDLGLMSYGETLDQGRNICSAVSIPVMGDGDTGYGNALNLRRTVLGFAQAGFASIMIEDQVAPKRCGHTRGKLVVDRFEALERIKAAVDAREELRAMGGDIVILARTDARADHGLDEAIWRANGFRDAGADMLFIEAPRDEREMERVTKGAPGIHLANMIAGGQTPLLAADKLHELGFSLAAFPLTLLSAAMGAMRDALADLAAGRPPAGSSMPFDEVRRVIGFDDYYEKARAYAASDRARDTD